MHPRALLDAATALVQQVLRFEQAADRVVSEFVRAGRAYGPRERQLLADTAFEVVRHLSSLGWRAQRPDWPATTPTERRLAVLGWQGDAAFLAAALDPAEAQAWRGAASIERSSLPEALRHDLPDWLAERMQTQLGVEFDAWAESVDRPAPLDLRVNIAKASREEATAMLRADGIEAAPTPHSPLGLRVVGKPALQASRAFVAGLVEVQDEGSQLIALALGARRGETVVDFCAGAGGKTLAIGAQMRGSGRIHAFDTSDARLAALGPRLQRARLDNVVTMRIDSERDARLGRMHGKADRVLVDAPCTGLGTLRRNPDLKWRHGEATLAALPPLQCAVLAAAARLVRPGGRLVYATCSPLVEEDEAVAAAFEAAGDGAFVRLSIGESLARARVAGAASLVEGSDLRLWTHRHGSDCFYAAAWQRLDGDRRAGR